MTTFLEITSDNFSLILVRRSHITVLVLGIFIGLSFDFVFDTYTYWSWIKSKVEFHYLSANDVNIKSRKQYEQIHTFDNNFVANQLYNEVKVLCWIMTCPADHQQKAIHIMRTWGKRCNKLLFMSSAKGL